MGGGASSDGLILPTRYRNSNYWRAAVGWLIPTTLFLIPLVAAPFEAKWFFAILFAVAGTASLYFFVSGRLVELIVSTDGLTLRGVLGRRSVPWAQVERFEIREPGRRTPFMLAFAWWIDQAKVILVDGSSVRIRAIEPRHGLTPITYFSIQRYTEADGAVDALNALLRNQPLPDA